MTIMSSPPLPELSADEWERYARQLGPGVVSPEGQRRLKASSVLVTRAGGMGGPAALALAMAGVGRIILAHSGCLTSADLNRQVLGDEAAVGRPRVEVFADRLRSINRFVAVEALDHEPGDEEALTLARRVDVLLACPPNFAERMRLNRAAVTAGKPLVDAAQWGLSGTLTVVQPGRTACLACVCPTEPPFEENFPVVGAISLAIGSLAALEAIKIIAGIGQPQMGRLWVFDLFQGFCSQMELQRNLQCKVCGE